MKVVCYSCILFFGLFCSGCYPLQFRTSPAMEGKVLSAESHLPVSGAQVSVLIATTNLLPVPDTITGQNGEFKIPSKNQWKLVIFLPGYVPPPHGLLVIKHDGYNPAVVEFRTHLATTNYGSILLNPLNK